MSDKERITALLDRFFPKQPTKSDNRNLPVAASRASTPVNPNATPPQIVRLLGQKVSSSNLPNATIIYGMAASGLLVAALFLLFSGNWLTSFLVMLLAICFLGFALHFMRHPQ